MRKRIQKEKQSHFGIIVNKSASNYNFRHVKKLIGLIRDDGGYYTVFEPGSAEEMTQTVQRICGLKKWGKYMPQHFSRRGQVTALIACGGDGTFNRVGRAALKADIPMGVVPMGKFNNIARSLLESDDPDNAIKCIINRKYKNIDTALFAGHTFFGYMGIGFLPQLENILNERSKPRFSMSWANIAAKAAAEVIPKDVIFKIDSFRFEVKLMMLNINLLKYAASLPFSPPSLPDDHQAEVIFDYKNDPKLFASFIRQVYKKKYIYGSDFKMFRGSTITFQNVNNLLASLDGDIMELHTDEIIIKIGTNQLKVFC